MRIELAARGDCLIRDFRVGQFFSLLNTMPGRKKWLDRNLVFVPSGVNLEWIMEKLPEVEWAPEAATLRDKYIATKMQEENTRQEKLETLTDTSGYEFKTAPLHEKQLQCFLLSRDREDFAILHEQGTGKTWIAINTAAYLYEKGEIDTLIVLAPTGVHINWVIEELPLHMPDRIPYQAVYFSAKWRDAEIEAMTEAPKVAAGVLRVITFHLEGIKFLRDGKLGKLQRMLLNWLQSSKALVVIDESSAIKNPSTDRTKFLNKQVRHLAKYRRIMTGTQLTTGIENLYSQYYFLDPNILGHHSYTSFRSEYCIMGGFEGREIRGYKNIDRLIKIIDGHSHRVLASECLKLPGQMWKQRPFSLHPAQERLYEALRKKALEEIMAILGEEEGLKRAKEIAVVHALRLHQVVCGLTPTSNPERMDGPNPRMEATLEEIEESAAGGRKVLVWARFKPDLWELLRKLGPAAVGYFGGIEEDDRIAALKKIQNDDKTRYFVASRAAARGFTLTAATRSVYHSQTSSLDDRLQSEKRNYRNGTLEKVLYTDVIAHCTASPDRKILRALRSNKELADQINKDPKSLFLEEDED